MQCILVQCWTNHLLVELWYCNLNLPKQHLLLMKELQPFIFSVQPFLQDGWIVEVRRDLCMFPVQPPAQSWGTWSRLLSDVSSGILSISTTVKSSTPSSLLHSTRYLHASIGSPWSLLFLWLNSPNSLSLFCIWQSLQTCCHLCGPLLEHSISLPYVPVSLALGAQNWTQHFR